MDVTNSTEKKEIKKEKQDLFDQLLYVKSNIQKLKKDKTNEFLGNSYVDLVSILDEVLPKLHEAKLDLSHTIVVRDGLQIMVTKITNKSGQSVFAEMPLVGKIDTMQAMGSAITYARRYTLQMLLSLNAEDDDGNKSSNVTNNKNVFKKTEQIPNMFNKK